MEMTMEMKDWLTAKNMVVEQLKKDGGKMMFANDALELYDMKTSEYKINVDTVPGVTGKTAWCSVMVKSSTHEGKGYIPLCLIDTIRDENRRLLEKYRNVIEGLNINVYYSDYLNMDCVTDEDGDEVRKYSVISILNISLRT